MARTLSIIRLKWYHALARWLLFPICFHLVRYRRKVVKSNLLLAFPEKNEGEIKHIERQFYLNFADLVMEILVARHFSKSDMQTFVTLKNIEPMMAACKQYNGCFAILGHFFNWEWLASSANWFTPFGVDSGFVYKRLSSRFFDKLMHKLRSQQGGFLVEMDQLLRTMIAHRNDPTAAPTCYDMIADQRPRSNAKQHETTLFGQPIGVLTGTEQLATRFDFPVFYTFVTSPKRGYYTMRFIQIFDPETDKNLPFGTVTERFTRQLEENIKCDPARWLWSHKRFAR